MRWLISTAMRWRVLVTALACALAVLGLQRLRGMPLDVFPEFSPPLIEVQTEAPGLSTNETEELVTVPLEAALSGLPSVKTLRSKSVVGLSSVVMILEPGSDLMRTRQIVTERTSVAAARLPDVCGAPVILPPLSATSRALKIGLSSKTMSQVELSELARWTIRPRLMAVPGVANVAVWGQRDRELQVIVDPRRLESAGVTLDEIVKAAGDAVVLATGGFVDTPNQRIAVRNVPHVDGPAALANGVVAMRNGHALRIGDVAEVVEGFPTPIGDAVINDGPGILLIVEKYPGGNTIDITRGVEQVLALLAPALKGVDVDPTIFRPATFVETALANLERALWIGCALVIVVLVLFLNDARTALISATAIPLSLIAAAVALAWMGQTMNTMVLAGLVIALGEVVDDAIIDVENIMRRLRSNAQLENPRAAFTVVLEASLEVRSSVVFGSLIIALVLMPVFFLEGLAGAFFSPLALAYVFAILASLAVALTVTPALCLWLLPGSAGRRSESPLVRWSKRAYGRALSALVVRPRLALGILALSIVGAAIVVPRLGEEFLPRFQEREFLMHWVEKPGTSLDAMRAITIRASNELRAIPGVRNFGAHIGRAEVADEVVGPNFTELWISLDSKVDYDATVAKVQEVVDGYPGLYRDLLTYLRERIKEVLTGASASVVVRVFGPDLGTLRTKAQEVSAAIATVEGVTDLKVEAQVLVPQLELRFDAERAQRFGLTAGEVRRTVTTLVRGRRVGEAYQGSTPVGVAVIGADHVRSDPLALLDLLIGTPSGAHVTLAEVCDIRIAPTPNEIKRENASRRIDVTCNVAGRDLGSVARDIQARVDSLDFDSGYHPELLGEHAERTASRDRLLLLSLVSLVGIALLLQADFGSLRLALLVLLTLPFALIGGVAGAALGGGVLSLGSLVGFITVLGIAARNAILMISHFQYLEQQEGMPFGLELVRRGAAERLIPILMTALAAGLALLPLVVSGDRPGQELEYPMAVVIVGGLTTSTVLCLLLLPAIYLRFGRGA